MIKEIIDKKEKSTITDTILRNLPKWFGIEQSILEYVNGVKESLFFYEGLNFHPLEEISEIWGKENPCLIMIKNI